MVDYYDVLNCKTNSTLDEIKKNYKELALKYHPDKCGTKLNQFLSVQEAWNILSDETKRHQFNKEKEIRKFRPLLFGTFKLSQLESTSAGTYLCTCRCGGTYSLDFEELELLQSFHTLHVPCESCSLMEKCNCNLHCSDRISKDECLKIYHEYEALNDVEKYIYFYGLIYKERLRRQTKLYYHLRINGCQVSVCQRTFRVVHKLPCSTLKSLTTKIIKSGLESRTDFNFAVKEDVDRYTIQPVKDHIRSLLEDNEFLDCLKRGQTPNFSKMWLHYKDTHESVAGTYKYECTLHNDIEGTESNEEKLQEQGQVTIMSLSTYTAIFKETLKELQESSCQKPNVSPNSIPTEPVGDKNDANQKEEVCIEPSPNYENMEISKSSRTRKIPRKRMRLNSLNKLKPILPKIPHSSNVLISSVDGIVRISSVSKSS